ncbi:MAG TPA: membrane protein insertase YidC [Streptosporangiaceae bacterium]
MRLSILNPLYDIVAWLIMHIHSILVPLHASSGWTWVLTIVVLVVLMRLLLLPLFVKQMHSQRKMLALAPQMKELRKRYKNDKQKLNEEMMKLYRENGANPLSGCLPLVAQLPVWYALLGVLEEITRWNQSQGTPSYGLTVSVVKDALNARIFGVSIADTFLHTPGTHVKVVIAIVVVCSAVTTFLTVRQSMKRGMMQTPTVDADNPMAGAQKYMAYIAPLFALSGLYWQFGLVIYWLASNVWTLGQQYFLFKSIPPLNVAAAEAGTAPGKAGAAAAPAPRVKQVTAPSVKRAAPGARPAAQGKTQVATGKQATAGKQSTGAAKQPAAQKAASAGKSASTGKPASTGKAAAAKNGGSAAAPAAAPNGSGGVLRKLVGKRAEPEPEPEPPEVTVVRQQRTRQSRSKRTGKR